MQYRTTVLFTAVLAGSLHAGANDIEPSKEKYTAAYTLTPITLDGKLTEWAGANKIVDPRFAVPKGSGGGANPNYVLFEEYAGGKWSGPNDQTSAVQVVYDADNVYFGFVVTDDYHENAANSAWNGDSVQLMIANGDRNQQVALYNYALGGVEGALGEVVIMHEAGPGGTEAIVTRDEATKKTYYEIKLPASALGFTTLTPGLKFGLGMAINDGDDGEGQNGQKGWGGLGAHAIVFGKTPSETALVTLGAKDATVEILGVGAESLLGSDLTDPENDGDETLGATDPSWNWAGITASHEPAFEGGENSFNIFDNKVGGGNDKWCCDDPTSTAPVWVAVQFKNPVSLSHFTVASGNDSPDRDPTDWQIQGSQDGANYTPIYAFKGATVPWTARNQVVKFTLPQPSPTFRYIRYIAYATPGTLHQINEIEYFGTYGGTEVAYLSSINPAIQTFGFRVNDAGTSVVDPASVKLTIDGANIALGTLTKTQGAINVLYTPARQFLPGTKHTYAISAKDGNGNTISSAGEWTTPNYALLTAADKVNADTAKRGFIWNVHQNEAFQANNNVRSVQQLAGQLGVNKANPDNTGIALGAGKKLGGENDPIQFEIDTFINLDQAGGSNGAFTPDDQMPGIPGTSENTDGIAGEILTFIELGAGKHTFIVNSDDGFITWAGNVADVFDRQYAGEFSGGRGAADTAYEVYVEAAGVYPFRTVWQEGGDGANIEYVYVKADGTKVLINDDANGGPKAFRAVAAGSAAPTAVTSVSPAQGANDVSPAANIAVTIVEGSTAVPSVTLSIDGTPVTPVVARNGKTITVTYDPPSDFRAPSTHKATIAFAGRTEEWSFSIPPVSRDKTSGKIAFLVGSKHSDDKGGRTGNTGDFSLDTGAAVGTAYVPDIAFFNAPTAAGDDTLTIAFWQKLRNTRDASGFWANSPSSNNGTRGFQAHTPWSNGNIYFDTSGCCGADTQRIDAPIANFADFTDATWWQSWHHFAFVKDGATKNIYIDGKLFHTGGGDPLPTDFTTLVIGGGPGTGDNRTAGWIDDFTVYAGALTEAQAKSLHGGAAASSVSGLLAHWDFNDPPTAEPETVRVVVVRNGASVNVTSEPAVLPAGWVLQTASSIGGPWTTQAAKTPTSFPIGAGNAFLRAAKP